MKDKGYTSPNYSCNNPQKHMAMYPGVASGEPKDTSAGMDLGRNATNVKERLGYKPDSKFPMAKPQNK